MHAKKIIALLVSAVVCYVLVTNTTKIRKNPRVTRPLRRSLRKQERSLTEAEQERCSAEIAALESLNLDFTIAKMLSGTSLAVMRGSDIVSSMLLSSGLWEQQETAKAFKAYDLMQQKESTCAQPPCVDKVFLDVGANLGTWTFYAAQHGYHTVSVEGSPPNFALLQLSKCLNPDLAPRINLINAFVSEGHEHCLIMCDLSNQGDVMLNCQDHEWTEPEMVTHREMLRVKERRMNVLLTRTMTRRLDDVIAEALAAHPNFPNVFRGMKIDIESSELMAMRGAPKLLAGQGAAELPIIFSEVWYHIRGGPQPDAYFQLMRAAGYELRDPSCLWVWFAEQDAATLARIMKNGIENVCFVKKGSIPAPVPQPPPEVALPPPVVPAPVPVPEPAPVPVPVPVPAPVVLAKHERHITDAERQTCSAEIAALVGLNIEYAIVKTPLGISLAVMRGNDIVSKALLEYGQWEHPDTVQAFEAYNRAVEHREKGTCAQPPCVDKVFLDVGTNLGTWSFYAALQGMHTVSVEGSPPNFALLQLSKCLNPELAPRINLVDSFVSEGSEYCLVVCDLANQGDVALNCQAEEWTEPAIDSYKAEFTKHDRNVRLTRTTTKRLDDIVAQVFQEHPNFPNVFHGMKIDIEGSELMAMRGSPKLLAGQGAAELPIIFSEVWYQIRGGPHPDAYFKMMREAGYELRDHTCGTVWPAEKDTKIVTRLSSSNIENVCFVKKAVSARLAGPPLPPLRAHERRITDEERQRCSAEIAALDELSISFTVAKAAMGASIAVMASNDIVSQFLVTSGKWEQSETVKAFQEYDVVMQQKAKGTCAQPPCVDKVFLDVGANLGTWTFYAALHGYHTVSVEGSPPNFALLQLSKCLNPDLAPRINFVDSFVNEGSEHCLVVCDLANQGDVTLNCKAEEWTEPAMTAYKAEFTKHNRNVRLTRTMTRQLDTIIAQVLEEHPNFPNVFHGMKIDIEGSELMAMRGAPKLLAGQGAAELPIIFSEVWYHIRGGPQPDAYFQLMRAAGYELRDPTCKNVWPAEQDPATLNRMKRTLIENVCFVKK